MPSLPREPHRTCENCAAFAAEESECRLYSPDVLRDEFKTTKVASVWPNVRPDQWCCQFVPVRVYDGRGGQMELGQR